MKLIDVEQKLIELKQPVLQTRDVSAALKIPNAQASKILERLAKSGRFVRLKRGKWATTKDIDPLILPEFLTSPFPSYISLQTALFYHGIISQIPHTIHAISLDRTQLVKNFFGDFSIHHIHPDFFFGFETTGYIKMATPEKALIDILYFSSAKSGLFKTLPELELLETFNKKIALAHIEKIPSQRIKSLVLKKFRNLFS
jgi:predicted transcriptional regulator of viral defense system